MGPAVLIDCNILNVGKPKSGFLQAVGDCLRRKTSPMLDAPEAFLFGCSNELAVTDERSGGITVIGVKAENDHACAAACAPRCLRTEAQKTGDNSVMASGFIYPTQAPIDDLQRYQCFGQKPLQRII